MSIYLYSKKMNKILIFALSLLIYSPILSQSFTKITTGELVTTKSGSRSANFVDINNDGWDDIFISNGPSDGENNMLYLNNQDGSFSTISNNDIVQDLAKSDGATFGDINNDGFLDLCVVTWYGDKNNFYHGGSNASFTEIENIISEIGSYSETASWGDYNKDGWLDLIVTNSAGNKRNNLYKNLGDGSFQEITSGPIVEDNDASRSIDWIDYDNDGDTDVFVTNENNQNNILYQNNNDDSFTKVTNISIVSTNKQSAGSSWADIDNDGDFDLFVANYQGQNNELHINNNDGTFTEIENQEIVQESSWSFGSSFADADNDGDLDLFVCNAFGGEEKNSFYINNGNGIFTKNESTELTSTDGWTFGCAWGDYNNDGFLDLLLANCKDDNQENGLFQNQGNDNNWFKLNLEGVQSNRSGIGSIIKLKASINGNAIWQMRKVEGQSGYNSQNSLNQHFGLGKAAIIDSIIVIWDSGNKQYFTDISVNQMCNLIEGNQLDCDETSGVGNSNNLNKLKIFPNPSKSKTINIENIFFENKSKIELKLLDSVGSTILDQTINNQHLLISLDVSHLPQGFYQLFLSQDGYTASTSLIIQ